tara:strand:- start:479 stop:1891 length:1413 start_codon:yes stop_codon:yes gene_type:complete
MKLSLASAGVVAGLATLGWVIFGEQDTKNAEAEEKSWDDYPDGFVDEVYPYDSHPNADTYDMADVENQYRIWENKIADMEAETSLQDFQDAIFSAIKPRNAVAVLAPNDNGVAGVVHFSQEEDTVHIDYDITGLTDGEHGFHIHTYGDLTDGCDSACSHFNPDNTEHGGLDSKIRHLGDLGNISSEKGVSKGRLSTDTLSLKSGKRNCIVGRMIIVHADRDDLGKGGDAESLKTGNAGKRVGCGVIGLAKGEVKCAETLEAEKVWGEKIISGWSGSNLSKKKAESFSAEDLWKCWKCGDDYPVSQPPTKIVNDPKDPHGSKGITGAFCSNCSPIPSPSVSLEDLMMAEDKATPIRHSRRLNGYYGIKGYEDASEDGFIYRIYRSPGTNDWFKAMVYDDNSRRESGAKHTSRRLNPSGQMSITNDPAFLLIGAFPKFEDAKRALVFRMIQDGNYHHMITDGNLKWLLKGNR